MKIAKGSQRHRAGWIWLSLSSIAVLLLVLVGGWWRWHSVWARWRPATCMPAACFCEAVRAGPIAQPANTWSSLGFVAAGLLIVGFAYRRPIDANLIGRQPGYAGVYALALTLTGVGSAFYHASLTFVGQFADVLGMYCIALFVVCYAVARLVDLRQCTFVVLFVSGNVALGALLWLMPALRRYTFALVLTLGLLLELLAQRRRQSTQRGAWLALALGTLAVAWIIWALDITHSMCAPTSWLQGHAVWHGLGALSALWLYTYYRSERPPVSMPSMA